jgi:hypothetical protein
MQISSLSYFNLIESWLQFSNYVVSPCNVQNGVLVGSNNSLTVSKSVPGKGCGWKSLYCYMCTVGNCGLQSELVCKSVDEYNCAFGNPGIVFPSPPTG